jgi:hypothetical protein
MISGVTSIIIGVLAALIATPLPQDNYRWQPPPLSASL